MYNLLRKADELGGTSRSLFLVSKVGWEQDEAPEKAIWMALETTMEMEPEPEHLLSLCVTVEGEVELVHQNFQVR